MKFVRSSIAAVLFAVALGCASDGAPEVCPTGTQQLPGCPPLDAVDDPFIDALYERRTWRPPGEVERDPVEVARRAEIPTQVARVKFAGTTSEDALNSLAAKIWMIEHAAHTIDVTYYIFTRDLIGDAILGALCNAVRRGVDVRFMVDSVGSMDPERTALKALEECSAGAGFIRNARGETTTKQARVQVVVFNAISKLFVNMNRRSHDKLLVVDGSFPDRAMVMTGGRNISLSYYGIRADGSPNPDTYMDAEILLRVGASTAPGEPTVGEVSESYYTLLFLFANNDRLRPNRTGIARKQYASDRREAQDRLLELKSLPPVKERLDAMPRYLAEDWIDSKVLLAHEFDNLTNEDVHADVVEHVRRNPNSIQHILAKALEKDRQRARIVSPYLFATEFYDNDGNEILDGARDILRWLDEDPERTLEIITNSVLTSDNFPAQSVIDMNMAPRLLLPKKLQEDWLDGSEAGASGWLESDEWKALIANPRLAIYETGRLDDTELGGDAEYGKLHAKYVILDDGGFVGTTNFDYRSRLLNNEMGFFFASAKLARELDADFELLKSRSYRWGSSDWLEMRRRLFETRGMKANTARSQRAIYKTLRSTGLDRQL